MARVARDRWAEWLLHTRHGDDPEQLRGVLEYLYPVRDRVLENARIAEGDTVLDAGCGDGLIAFGALERVGPRGRVVFSDVSQDLLDICREFAARMGALDRCRFVRASADDLAAIPDGSVDALTVRSVLIYVAHKRRALGEFHRVLKPGGRLSVFEPINRFAFPEPEDRLMGYDVTPVKDLALRVRAVWERIQPPGADPMSDFDERDLLRLAGEAGFGELHMELKVDVRRHEPRSWDGLMGMSFNPKLPTVGETMRQALAPHEVERLTAHLRPLVQGGEGRLGQAVAYLWAVK